MQEEKVYSTRISINGKSEDITTTKTVVRKSRSGRDIIVPVFKQMSTDFYPESIRDAVDAKKAEIVAEEA
jgi:hypothetical protein